MRFHLLVPRACTPWCNLLVAAPRNAAVFFEKVYRVKRELAHVVKAGSAQNFAEDHCFLGKKHAVTFANAGARVEPALPNDRACVSKT